MAGELRPASEQPKPMRFIAMENSESTKTTPTTVTHQPDQGVFREIRTEDVQWRSFATFPSGARLAVLVGDPTKPEPYVIRVHLPDGTRMMPHRHIEDRIYTVISGVFYIGLGDTFDENKLTAHAPGSVVVLPAGQAHFHWARSGDYVTQVSAIGPLGLAYVDAAHDPRNAASRRG